ADRKKGDASTRIAVLQPELMITSAGSGIGIELMERRTLGNYLFAAVAEQRNHPRGATQLPGRCSSRPDQAREKPAHQKSGNSPYDEGGKCQHDGKQKEGQKGSQAFFLCAPCPGNRDPQPHDSQKPEDHLAPQLYAPQQTSSQRIGSKTKIFMGEVVMKVSLRIGQTFIGVDRPLALLMLFSAQLRRRRTHEEVR